MPKGRNKILSIIFLISFAIANVLFAFPKPAKAQWVVSNPDLMGMEIQKKVEKTVGATIMQAGTLALVNGLNYFVQKIAYDTAVWIASAGPGQKPLFDGRSFGKYVGDVGKNSIMKSIETLSTETGLKQVFGFDFCAPNLKLLLKLKLGILSIPGFGPPREPDCSWQTMVNNWETFGKSFATPQVLKNFSATFEPGKSDLGFALEFNNRLAVGYEQDKANASAERQRTGGWKSVTDAVSKQVVTPEDVVKGSFGKAYLDTPYSNQTASFSAFGNALGAGALQIIPAAIQSFANTLLSKTMERITTGVFSLFDIVGEDDYSGINDGDTGATSPTVGRRKAEEIYGDFIKPKITSASNYDPLLEFTVCPDNNADKQINNCVLDDNFASAVRLASQGRPITVSEAITQGLLDGNKPLIPSSDARNQEMSCYQEGYCYSNLVKLRKARILPVGFELAAELGNVGNVSATQSSGAQISNLQNVMNGFYDCNASGSRDTQHPYCHLIDPNWVLKLPKTQCNARVYGPTLVSSAGALRSDVCADPVTCLSEDESGNCTGGFSYCTKEKNVWKIPADKCGEQYNSCLTYKSRDNTPVNYIKNTVNFDSCVAENTGCRAYSINKNSTGWSGAVGDNIYFNKDVPKCEAKDAGCTEVYTKTKGLAYNLLPNPSFEAMVGANGVVGWTGAAGMTLSTDGANAYDGKNGVIPVSNLVMNLSGMIKLELNTAYAFSGYVKTSNASAKYRLALGFYTDSSGASALVFDPANIVSTCKTGIGQTLEIAGETDSRDYSRVSCAFLTPNQTLYTRAVVSGPAYIDAVQLEEGSSATAFLPSGYGTTESLNIKLAPSYLDCQAGGNNPECAGYAPTCRADEVGCQNYTPKNGDPVVSGTASINDVCPASCVGYETYKQDATLYEADKFPNFFIPTTAASCPAQDVGCDEFTNLANESKEYFNFIRQCMKPDANNDAVFYTWEGSDTSGYQLKSHRLKVDLLVSTLANPVPAQILNTNPLSCSKAIFTAPITDPNYNPDCREFYNAAGTVSYKLLSKTIISTEECTDYRKTDSDITNCQATGGVWNNSGQYCAYKGYKPASSVCPATSNSCRAYSGSASNNLRIVFQDDFEASSASGWTNGAVSPESLTAGGHSLKGSLNSALTKDLVGLVSANNTYILSFWAKAPAGGRLTVNFANTGAIVKAGSNIAELKGDWRFYEVGPFNLSATIAGASLQIAHTGGTGFYIDNIVLKEVSQKLYLIKNSWKTPNECDQTIGGLFLPQAMLGCKAYTDKDKNPAYFKSFSSLCRPEAIGCAGVVNTQNNKTDKNEIYNVICARGDATGGDCKYNGATVCSVGLNNSICRFTITDGAMPTKSYKQSNYKDFAGFQAQARTDAAAAGGTLIARDESTRDVPKDKTIYVVNDKQYYCQEKDLGCSALGQGELYTTPNATTVYYKNNPANYGTTLCTAEAEGCESWTSNKGADYFKVPVVTCEYRDNGQNTSGWFQKGKDTACYPGFMRDGIYGIWRNADTGYNGSVGLCPSAQNGCTEFIDPLDTSAKNKTGKPYYIIDNEKLKALENDQSCAGKASLESGCVLFNKTSDNVLKWNAGATYAKATTEKKISAPVSSYGNCSYQSGNSGYSNTSQYCFDFTNATDCPAPPVGYAVSCVEMSSPQYDSNDILKVTRDRECGEWLACKSSYTAFDPITNKAKSVCAEIGLCDKQVVGGSTTCANFVVNNADSGQVLTADNYSRRQVGWAGKDYSGYSIGNQFPVTDVETIDADSSPDEKDLRLFVSVKTLLSGGGFALENKNIDGTPFDKNKAEKSICRGFPEQDSPFPYSIGIWDINKRLQSISAGGLQNANICGYGQNCECDYTKLTYGTKAVVKYTSYGNRSVDVGVCQGGSNEGLPCKPGVSYEEDQKLSCGKPEEGGTCVKLQRQDDVIGWSGYCLERDATTPINGDKNQKACITWLPQDIVPGSRDIYNQFRTAGYIPPIGGGKYYCLQAEGNYSYSPLPNDSGYDIDMVDVNTNPIGGVYNVSSNYTIDILGDNLNGFKTSWNPRGIFYDLGNVSAKRLIYKDTIDLIKIKIGKANITALQSSIPENAVFYIRADQKSTEYMSSTGKCNVTKTNNCSGEGEGAGTLTGSQQAKSLKEGNVWYFRFNDGQGNNSIDFIGSDLTSSDINSVCIKQANDFQTGFQFKFTFDKDTGVLTTISYIGCDANATLEQPASFSASFSVSLRETCSVVADTAAFKNQAYTDRIWAYNANNLKGKEVQPLINDSYGTVTLPYHYNYEIQPFGSAAADTAPSQLLWYSYYAIGTPNFAGVPWSCKKNCGTPGVVDEKTGKTGSDNDLTTVDFQPSISSTILRDAGESDSVKGRAYLNKLFSKIFNIFQLDNNNRTYQQNICDAASSNIYCDLPNDKVDVVKYPKVFAFNPNKKLSNGQYQLADENRVLVNNQLSNINISGNQYLANLRFYFWADTDHMPIRSIKVDWGDGSTVETTDGLYKNHKPLCAKNNTDAVNVCSGAHGGHNFVCDVESGCPVNKYINLVSGGIDAGSIVSQLSENQTCSAKNTLFGNSLDACDESYFEFQHTYICSSGAIGYDSNANTCSFVPKVIITDNWGIDNTFNGAMIQEKTDLKNKAGFLGPATGPTIKLIL